MSQRGVGLVGLGVLLSLGLGIGVSPSGIRFSDGSVLATADTRRSFYLTDFVVPTTGVLIACDDGEGYEAASLWQLLHASGLRYAAEHPDAATRVDSGSGPPSGLDGWIRTGNVSGLSTTPGVGNCSVWTDSTSNGPGEGGSVARLDSTWNSIQETPSWSGWVASAVACNAQLPVWCVQP